MNKTTGLLSLLFAAFTLFTLHAQAPGSLDTQFGGAGSVQAAFLTFPAKSQAMTLQADGKILLGGVYTSGGLANMAFARFNSNGTPDNSFGTSGKSTIAFTNANVDIASIQAISGGKIIVAGTSNNKPVILRLTAAGAADNTFGTSGIVTFDGSLPGISDMVVLANGKMIGCGLADQGSGKLFTAFRRNADGTADNTFGTNGFAYADVDVDQQSALTRMAVQPDGKILLTGTVYTVATKYDLVLFRFAANGTPDNTFGTAGKVTTILSTSTAYEQGNAIAVQGDGKIVVAGRIANAGPTVFAIVRYAANGAIDTGFGTNGSTTLNFNNSVDEPKAVAMQADNKIVVVGSSVSGSSRYLALARLNKNGTPDITFDADGKVTTLIGTKAYGEALALQPDGKIVVGGYAAVSNVNVFVAARYNAGTVVGTQELETGLNALQVFPNPVAAGGKINLQFDLDQAQTCRFQLFGTDGRLLRTYPAQQLTAGRQVLALETTEGMPGQVMLRIETKRGATTVPVVIF